MADAPKYPHITANLIGRDGNVVVVLGIVRAAMRSGGVPQEDIDAFQKEATSGDYEHLLATVIRYVDIT